MLTDTDGRIEYANPAFEEVSGYAREEVVGETPALLRSGAHDEAFYADLWETITDGEVWENEVVNRRKNGDPYHLEQTIAPIVADDGEIERSVAINTDISDLKNQERELKRQNERLERYGRTVAHDLRNPLNVLEARIEYLETNEVESLDEHCETMYQSIAKMKTLIDELLTLAKHGQTVLEPTALSLEEVAATAWSQSETRTATLLVSDSVLLMADETRLEELFGNLFRNVAEHVGPDATVRVGTLDDADGFYVADDGPGIPEDERENVLDLGYTTAEEGTGFGLAIVNEIAEAHGWSVRITESADGGTRFEISQVDGVESASPRDGDE
jgi:PAS domain S-box-containing protein